MRDRETTLTSSKTEAEPTYRSCANLVRARVRRACCRAMTAAEAASVSNPTPNSLSRMRCTTALQASASSRQGAARRAPAEATRAGRGGGQAAGSLASAEMVVTPAPAAARASVPLAWPAGTPSCRAMAGDCDGSWPVRSSSSSPCAHCGTRRATPTARRHRRTRSSTANSSTCDHTHHRLEVGCLTGEYVVRLLREGHTRGAMSVCRCNAGSRSTRHTSGAPSSAAGIDTNKPVAPRTRAGIACALDGGGSQPHAMRPGRHERCGRGPCTKAAVSSGLCFRSARRT